MSPSALDFTIVDPHNRQLWVRSGAGFTAARALDSLAALQSRFPEIRMFLFAVSAEEAAGRRRYMLRNPNLRATRLQAGTAGDAPPEVEEPPDAAFKPASPRLPGGRAWVEAFVEVELWHRRHLIKYLNYPGLPFATEAPTSVPRADFELVAEFLAPAHQPLSAVFRMSQNKGYTWVPGEDRRSTSIGDVLIVKGEDDAPTSNWLVMAMGFDSFDTFD